MSIDVPEQPHLGTEAEFVLFTAARKIVRACVSPDFRFRAYYAVLGTPVVGDAYIRLRGPLRNQLITRKVDLVVDGFPRSANSLVRVMLEQLHSDGLRLSTHLHTPRALIKSVRLGLPSVALIRDPDDAVASLLQLQPGISAITAFRIYENYYTKISHIAEEVLIAHFPEVVGDFGEIMRKVNARFGTTFIEQTDSVSPNSRETLERIVRRAELLESDQPLSMIVASPSARRVRSEQTLAGLDPRAEEVRARAQDIYLRLLEVGG